eukprot:223598-Pyramimonas_sp.AAC.1
MDFALRQASEAGWTLTWQAVRRRLNKAADRLATLGVFWADALRRAGDLAVTSWIVWDGSQRPPPPLFPAAGVDLCDLDRVA